MKTNKSRNILAAFLCLVLTFFCISPIPTAYAVEKKTENDPEVQAIRQQIADLQSQIKQNEAKQAELESEMDAVSVNADQLQSQISALQSQIDGYNVKISLLNKQINEFNNSIAATEASIADTERKMVEQQTKIAETQKLLGERLRAMYMSGNMSKIEIIMEADSFESLLNRLELVAQIAIHDNRIVKELEADIAELQQMIVTLEQKKVELEAQKKELEASKAEVVSARNEINSKKSVLDSKMRKLTSYLAGLESNSKELQRYQNQMTAQQEAYDAQIFRMLNGIASTGDGTLAGGMIWPVSPAAGSYISSGYGNRQMGGEGVTFHKGIDIARSGANDGRTNIVAAATGIVILVHSSCNHNYPKSSRYQDPHYNTYGNCVYIDHGNGVITRYGHLGRVSVSVGQTVSMGQIIGSMGCTGYSTGFHLHFEVRVNTNPVNPMSYVRQP